MTATLVVPIHLDALFLQREETVLDPMADFSRLPFYDGKAKQDANAHVAYVSEEVVSHPFRDQGLKLGPGVHLHWALPDALSRGSSIGSRTVFPAVPDRWLVVRSGYQPKRWIVESDYLYPEGWRPGRKLHPISLPLPPSPPRNYQPYRYMGRAVEAADWPGDGRESEFGGRWSEFLNSLPPAYLEGLSPESRKAIPDEGLTVMGYGEPAFAAFYPNCHSVFGFHDREVTTAKDFKKARYDIIGWYNDPERDCLRSDVFQQVRASTWDRKRREYAAGGIELGPVNGRQDLARWYKTLTELKAVHSNEKEAQWIERQEREAWHEAVEHHFKWTVEGDRGPAEFTRSLFRASLTSKEARPAEDPLLDTSPIRVAVGNTAGEALSAFLADRLSGDKVLIEEQLEALHLGSQLEHRQLDIGPKFLEKRHGRGFRSYPAGWVWSVRLERNAAGERDEPDDAVRAPGQPTLPAYLAHALNELNAVQRDYDRARHEIDSRRREIYQDWTLYMHAARPPEWKAEEYPDPAEVGLFIETTGLKPLRRKLAATGVLNLPLERDDASGHVTRASVPDHTAPNALARRLNDGIETVLRELGKANQALALLGVIDAAVGEHRAGAADAAVAEGQNESPGETARAAEETLRAKLLAFAAETSIRCQPEDSLDTLRDRIHRAAGAVPSEERQDHFVEVLERLAEQLGDQTDSAHRLAPTHYVLRHLDAPRYHRPNNPVVLMEGKAVRPTERHGADGEEHPEGKLACRRAQLELPPQGPPGSTTSSASLSPAKVAKQLDRLVEAVQAMSPPPAANQPERIGHRSWRQQPWHPFLMEWRAKLEPLGDGGNADPRLGAFATDYIARNYQLPEAAVDLEVDTEYSAVTQLADTGTFRGRSLLSDHARGLLLDKLKTYLSKTGAARVEALQEAHAEVERDDQSKTPAELRKYREEAAVLKVALERLLGLLRSKLEEAGAETPPETDKLLKALDNADLPGGLLLDEELEPVVAELGPELRKRLEDTVRVKTLTAAYRRLGSSNTLSQALDGFHEALLQRHQVLQLPIDDSVGFAAMRPLTEAVRRAVQGFNTTSPLRDNDFTPIRSGDMSLLQLRLVDTFGRVKSVLDPVSSSAVVVSETLRNPGRDGVVALPPRLVQAARINFRWLAAEHATGTERDEPEMNPHPAYTPVCGWLMPNNLDNSLMVYDGQGAALGSIVERGLKAVWEPAPGSPLPGWAIKDPNSSQMNPHLRKLVHMLVHDVGQDDRFVTRFVDAVNNALETIAPEEFSHHKSLALLMGRPIAVVRAMVDLELRGRPAFNQGMDALWSDMHRTVEEPEVAAEGGERRGQFLLIGEEGEAFAKALRRRHVARIRPAFDRRGLRLPPDREIRITENVPDGDAQADHGHWRIHLPARSYVVLQEPGTVHVFLETSRTTDAFTRVRFPIRIGEYQQLNDGLVGYWVEKADNRDYHYQDNTFWSPQGAKRERVGWSVAGDLRSELNRRRLPRALRDKMGSGGKVTIEKTGYRWLVRTPGAAYSVVWTGEACEVFELLDVSEGPIQGHLPGRPIHLRQSIDDPPQKLTMLVDPQGSVHAVSGILPTKSISIPPDQYTDALEKIEVTFLSTPVLTDRESLRLPLTPEVGYGWSWLAPRRGGWAETNRIDKIDTHAHFGTGQRIVEGWLKLRRKEP